MLFILNELSATSEISNGVYQNFLKLCLTIKYFLPGDAEELQIKFHQDELAGQVKEQIIEHYSGVEKSLLLKFLSFGRKKLAIEPVNNYLFNDAAAFGLGIAYENEGYAVSLQTDETWEHSIIKIIRTDTRRLVSVNNLTSTQHAIDKKLWLLVEIAGNSEIIEFATNKEELKTAYKNRTDDINEILFPRKSASDEWLRSQEIDSETVKNWQDFYEKIKEKNNRIALIQEYSRKMLEVNGWEQNNNLTRKNKNRPTFKNDKIKKYLLALDTENSTLEVHNERGEHLAEINLTGKQTKIKNSQYHFKA